MRMTANCGREEERRKKNCMHSWQKQHGMITQLFFIHSPLHSHMISKGTKALRKPSSKHRLPILQACHSLSIYQLVPHKEPLPAAVATVVVFVPTKGKQGRRGHLITTWVPVIHYFPNNSIKQWSRHVFVNSNDKNTKVLKSSEVKTATTTKKVFHIPFQRFEVILIRYLIQSIRLPAIFSVQDTK